MECAADLVALRCTAPMDVTEQRITVRLRDATDSSEATVEVARAMAQIESPWPWAAVIDTARPQDAVLADALRNIGPSQGETGTWPWANRSTEASGPGNTSPTWPSSDQRTR